MSLGGGGSGTQTQTQETKLPGWVDRASHNNYLDAKEASRKLQGPWEGQRVVDLTQGQQGNINAVQNNVGATNPAFQQASGATSNFLNYGAGKIDPQTLAQTNLNPYMNPYTNSVVNYGLQALDQQRQQALNQTGAQAAQARAFGGSRQGIQEAVTNMGAAQQAGQLASGLQSQNFLQAQAAATGDITRNMSAQQANEALRAQAAGISMGAANQMGSLASQGQQAYLQGLTASQGFQGQLQAQTQAELDAQRQLYAERGQYPLQQLAIRQQALSQSPYGNTVTMTGPGPTSSGAMQGMGMASSAMGMIGSMAPLLAMSDRRLKTDIRKVGTHAGTQLPMYSYRYKGDPKTYPKVVGPMAQDIQKKYPDQVAQVGKHLAVSTNFLGGMGVASHG